MLIREQEECLNHGRTEKEQLAISNIQYGAYKKLIHIILRLRVINVKQNHKRSILL